MRRYLPLIVMVVFVACLIVFIVLHGGGGRDSQQAIDVLTSSVSPSSR